MNNFAATSHEITAVVNQWYLNLLSLNDTEVTKKRNSQQRNIKQITGHMVDSATNNLHRVIHLQYQTSPLNYPDYANLGNNDRWIAIQNYETENWTNLVNLWKYINLHFAHTIQFVNHEKIHNVWISALDQKVSLDDMIVDYPRHLKLHIDEITDLIND